MKKYILTIFLVSIIGLADTNITSQKKLKRLAIVPFSSTSETNNTKPVTKDSDINISIVKKKKTTIKTDDFTDLNIIIIKEKTQNVNRLTRLPSFDNLKLDSYQSTYKIKDHDTIGAIARRFNVAQSEILAINPTLRNEKLKIGKDIFMPISQDVIDSISNEEYKLNDGDTIEKIAKKLKIKSSELKKYNKEKLDNRLKVGETIIIPLPSNVSKSKYIQNEVDDETIIIKEKTNQLRVISSAYTSHVNQTSSTPFIGAWGYRLIPGQKIIAVSRDLITEYGLTNGKKVKIGGLDGEYIVRDKMNKRYEKHIDIYMGLEKNKALRWGRRSVIIYW